MSDERHDEIAARLRAEAGARAPERLRADVMLQVRGEPRPRRIRPRQRRMWRPLGAVAAVACVVAALIVGLSHGVQSSPSVAGGGGTASAGAAASRAPESVLGPLSTEAHGTVTPSTAKRAVAGTSVREPAQALARLEPYGLAWRAERLPPGLRRALEALMLDRRRGAH